MFGETLSVKAYKNSNTSVTDIALLTTRVSTAETDIDNLEALIPVVSNIAASTIYGVGNYLISADATSGAIDVTIPSASISTGKEYTITKTDSTSNIVSIKSSSLVAGEAQQDLILQHESLTFFSNGIVWNVK